MTTPESFAPGYRLTDGNQLNYRIANPQWSTTSSVSATSGGTLQTSAKIVNAVTNITNASVPGAGVTLPQALEGTVLLLSNNSGNDVRVFADGQSTINGLDGQIGILLAKGTAGIFTAVATKQWSQLNATANATVVTVTNIAALRNLAVNLYGIVFVEGYYDAGDGGEGFFYGAVGGTYVDNKGTIITANSGSASSAWLRFYVTASSNYGTTQAGEVNVKWFGAKGDGYHDDTSAINAALAASKVVTVPAGRYILSGTLVCQGGQLLTGAGPETTLFQRTTNPAAPAYGDTMTIGSGGSGAFNCHISGIWFYKYQQGVDTITLPVIGNSAHLVVSGSSGGIIHDCWFDCMPYGIVIDRCSLFQIKYCKFTGLWDPKTPAAQESVASIYLKTSGPSTYSVTVQIHNCNIAGGFASAARPVVVGNVTIPSLVESIGPKYGILASACEDFYIYDNYIGGNSAYGIYLERDQILDSVKIEGNYFDAAIESCIYTNTLANNAPIGSLVITGNTFNGQTVAPHGLVINDPSYWISAINVNITGNVFYNFAGTPIIVTGGNGVVISSNNISAYNTANNYIFPSPPLNTTPEYASGIYVASSALNVHTANNLYGGGVGVLGGNYCKWGAYFSNAAAGLATFSASNERAITLDLAGGSVVAGVSQTYPTVKTVLTPTLLNSWVDYGSGTQPAGYWISDDGMVHLQGFIKSGTLTSVAFQLPAGYRPAAQVQFSTVSNNAFGYGTVNSDGNVIPGGGSNVSFSLDNISFKAG